MGSMIYTCNSEEVIINQDIYLSFEENNNQKEKEQKLDIFIKLLNTLFIKSYFQILKNYVKGNKNDNTYNISAENMKHLNDDFQNDINDGDNEINNNIEDIKNKEILNKKINNNNRYENDNKKYNDLQSNNGNLTLNSSSVIKSMNNNDLDTQINDNINNNVQHLSQNQETPNPSISYFVPNNPSNPSNQNNPPPIKDSNSPLKAKKITKVQKKTQKKIFTDNLTPIPEYPTPAPYYDKSKMPGDLIFNFNDIPLNDEIIKVENDLGEFIIEEKEILKYMEQYPYVPKSFSIRYPTGEKYSGYFSPDWEKEVFGIQINKDGSKYVGLFKNGMFEGRGRLILSKGDYYEGEFKQNKANGFGKYVNVKGEIYIGNWLDDKQEGEGELILKDGSRYNGQFKNGMKNGKGKISWNDSSYYEGEFVDNYYEGYGVYMMRNRKAYIGEWKKSQMNGFGIFICPDGKSYKGYYENDKKNGFGIYSGKNNLRYEGKYKKGRQYGIGRITNEKGEKQLGLYLKGKRLKLLKEKDFKEDIALIDKEIEKINNIIKNNEFFVKNIGLLTIIQEKYFSPE